jgi:hypothetical protein
MDEVDGKFVILNVVGCFVGLVLEGYALSSSFRCDMGGESGEGVFEAG